MKKIFKALAVLAATTAIGAGIGMAAGCSKGYDGVYYGEYHYPNAWNPTGTHYGMKVRVTVENNIIVKVEDVTKGEYIVVSDGWTDKDIWTADESYLLQKYEGLAVSDVLAIQVFLEEGGQPYARDKNSALGENGILITNATQGSCRLLLAVQDALGKTTEYGRIEKAD
ncbi:MAG: hypothetical protein K2I30_07180 [Clostridia bacterium]|nr:hypothetical protein [Clostridia bacterium]